MRVDSHPHRCSRETLVAADYTLLSLAPVGVDVIVMMARVAPGKLTDSLVVDPDPVPAVAIFALAVAAATTGENAA